ncbi:MAG: ribonuclease III [Bacteroidales bacterium]
MRLFALRRKEPYLLYHELLGFYPGDIELYDLAFVHKSSSVKREDGKWINNERLEFLGDAVLDAIVAELLFQNFKNKKEGFLTNTRSKIVSREMLNNIALGLGLDKFIIVSDRTRTQNSSIFGNALEALIGAIYLDKGFEVTKTFVCKRMIAPYVDLTIVADTEINFKSKLIEWGQKNKVSIAFDLIDSYNGEDNRPIFVSEVKLEGLSAAQGIGSTKKESQQEASKLTLDRIKKDSSFKSMVLSEQKRQD